jgi:hypothetical protein
MAAFSQDQDLRTFAAGTHAQRSVFDFSHITGIAGITEPSRPLPTMDEVMAMAEVNYGHLNHINWETNEPSRPLPTMDEVMAMADENYGHLNVETPPWDPAMGESGLASYGDDARNGGASPWNHQSGDFETGTEEPVWATDFSRREPEPTPTTSPAARRNSSQRQYPPPDGAPTTDVPFHDWQAYYFANAGTGAPLHNPTTGGNNNGQVDSSPTESDFSIESTSEVGYVADASTRLFPIYEEPDEDDPVSEMELTPIASGRLIEWIPPALTEEEVD